MSATDLIVFAVIILGAGFTLVFGVYLWTSFSTAFNSTASNAGSIATISQVNTSFTIFDTLFIFLQIGLMIALVISFYYIDSHPIYFFLSLFMLGLAIVLGASFSNMWEALGNQPSINATVTNYFPQSDWLMDNLPLLLLITGLISLAVLYGKSGGGGT